jgi:hypothetical protein
LGRPGYPQAEKVSERQASQTLGDLITFRIY